MWGPGAIARMAMRLFGRYALRRGAQLAASPEARERLRAWLEEGDEPGRARPGREVGMFERFTGRARRVVVQAQKEARSFSHPSIGTEHLLLGLLDDADGAAAAALRWLGLGPEELRERVESRIERGDTAPEGHLAFTSGAKTAMELALRESVRLEHGYIGTEHLLLGLVREGEGIAAQVLDAAVTGGLETVRIAVLSALSEGGPESEPRAGSPDAEEALRQALDGVTARLEAIEARLTAIEQQLGDRGTEVS